MRRLLFVVLLLVGATFVPTAGVKGADKITFSVGQLQNIDSLNVTVGALVIDYEIWNLIWPSLTNMAAKDFSAEPSMAESWSSSDDGLVWTYKMRPDMKWSDGEPLTAEDVKYTIDRANEEAWNSHVSTTASLTAEVIDENTLEITSAVPDPRLPALGAYIIPKHIYEKVSAEDLPNYPAEDQIGGGPFMLDEVAQDFTRLVRNPNWFGKKPAMDEVIFRFYADANAQFQALQGGEIDVLDGVPEQSYASIEDSDTIEAIAGNQGGFSELSMNSGCSSSPGDGHPALTDIKVRQAVNYAIDRDLLVERRWWATAYRGRPSCRPPIRRGISRCPRASCTATTPRGQTSCWMSPAGSTPTATAPATRTVWSCSYGTSIAAKATVGRTPTSSRDG